MTHSPLTYIKNVVIFNALKGQMLYIDIYISGDQPTTCPKCGTRTEIIFELPNSVEKTQLHKCLTIKCSFIFIVEEDIDFQTSNEENIEILDEG